MNIKENVLVVCYQFYALAALTAVSVYMVVFPFLRSLREKTRKEVKDMDANEFYPSKWLMANDITHGETGTVDSFSPEQVRNGTVPTIRIKNSEGTLHKPFILNKKNNKAMMGFFGKETAGWIGKQIRLDIEYYEEDNTKKPTIVIKLPEGS